MQYRITDINDDATLVTTKSLANAISQAAELVATRNIEYIVDELDEQSDIDDEQVESFKVVIKKLGRFTYDVYTSGGDDVLRVEAARDLVTEPTFVDLYK